MTTTNPSVEILNVRTAHGTVHAKLVGQSYRLYGAAKVNGRNQCGRMLCGAITSIVADVTDADVSCVKCAERLARMVA